MQLQEEIDDLAFSPSFNCYFSDSLTATAAAKVSREFKQEQAAQFLEFSELDEEDFEFSMEFNDQEVSGKQFTIEDQQPVFTGFNSEVLTKDEVVDLAVEETDDASAVTSHFQKLFVDDHEESSSSSSSESDNFGVRPSGIFCMWRPKRDVASSPLTKGKKSSSTGSGSRLTWRIRNLLLRSNSEGKESIFFLSSKKIKASKQSGEVTKVAGKLKTASSPSFQELFYVQRRAEQKGDKMKSFLPYRQDLLGFFVNINRIGNKKLSF